MIVFAVLLTPFSKNDTKPKFGRVCLISTLLIGSSNSTQAKSCKKCFFQSHLQQDSIDILCTKISSYRTYISTLNNLTCFNACLLQPLLIVDLGASVCILPLQLDFVTYKHIKMKTKGLSSSNTVTGEGIIKWNIINSSGATV
jgi:hypothetical protein